VANQPVALETQEVLLLLVGRQWLVPLLVDLSILRAAPPSLATLALWLSLEAPVPSRIAAQCLCAHKIPSPPLLAERSHFKLVPRRRAALAPLCLMLAPPRAANRLAALSSLRLELVVLVDLFTSPLLVLKEKSASQALQRHQLALPPV
jgi:hypothetical protein